MPHRTLPVLPLVARNHTGKVHAHQPRPALCLRNQRRNVEQPSRIVRDHGVWRTEQPDAPGQSTGVDARDPDLATRRQPCLQRPGAAKIGGRSHIFAHHAAHRARGIVALVVFIVDANIADMREGEGDDLPGIAGIGQHFLIAAHRRVEAHFAHRCAHRAKAPAPSHRAICQHETTRCAQWLRRVWFWRVRVGGVGHYGGAPWAWFCRCR